MSKEYLKTDYSTFIAVSRYARWLDDKNRRETWEETVDRFIDNVVKPVIPLEIDLIAEIRTNILFCRVLPSMRAMMTAGPALTRDNTAGYNCAYLVVDDQKAFDECMFILLCGTGVGFSVERQYISKLPEVPDTLFQSDEVIKVKDSKEGWAKALRKLIALLYAGEIPTWDVSLVRPAGAKLKTFGGRASGPEPLIDLFNFVINIFVNAKGRRLTSLECHDILCKIGEVVVVGGVRRSAMISLSNLSDDRMRHAKSGQWWEHNGQRALSNNSVAYTEKPDMESFMREWLSLMESKSGERGIFNRVASQRQAAKNGRRKTYEQEIWDGERFVFDGKRNPALDIPFGTNPCSEIILRPNQFCNLSEVVVRSEDTLETLKSKVRVASILGTIQSTLTNFPYLRKIWKDNTEEERLLGVSLTGIMDHLVLSGKSSFEGATYFDGDSEDTDWFDVKDVLSILKKLAITTNLEWAEKLGIPQSAAVTCVKPSGTVSQLVDSASGIHARHSEYYIRTVRGDNKDPLTVFMKEQGIPSSPDVTKPKDTSVFSFPMKSPKGAVTRNDMTALEQLELWLTYQRYWCEHKPSVTITVRDHEWMEVGAWVYKYFDEVSGVSFLPHSDHTYQQAPYQECSKDEYEKFLSFMPENIDWSKLSEYELEDTSKGISSFACVGGNCEIVDLT